MRIKQLPREVYDLIAAGEVVLAPVSVVKELVENALDAGASRVIVETSGGGIDKIRVADNGTGIAPDEISLAFAQHATSKLNDVDDLTKIETLGFRGEALASIAAVSRVTMVTRTAKSEIGSRAFAEGGAALDVSQTGADVGTDVTVEELFYNIPARRKHLGEARAEGRKIIEYVAKAAVSSPNVAFRLISDGALVFSTLGKGDRLAAIAAAYGSKTAENLIPLLDLTDGGNDERKPTAHGYISGPLGLRANRKGQHFFVNGRPVANAALDGAVNRGYREFTEPARFPVVFLFLSVDPETIDVNVHPAKNEISFVDAQEIADIVEKSIRQTLQSERGIPRLKPRGAARNLDPTFHLTPERVLGEEAPERESVAASEQRGAAPVAPPNETLVSTSGGDAEKVDMVDVNNLLSSKKIDDSGINRINSNISQSYPMVDDNELQSSSVGEHFAEKNADDHYAGSFNPAQLQPFATLFATYILATDGDIFYMVDQHAAHERVNYERFLTAFERREIPSQSLVSPYLFTPPAMVNNLAEYTAFFAKLGYEIDEFGENTWAARTFPAFVSFDEGAAFLSECLSAAAGEPFDMQNSAAVDRIIQRACKSSVKANQTLSDTETAALLSDLSRCRNPFTCPHGRPVFLRLTRADIERMFKRA